MRNTNFFTLFINILDDNGSASIQLDTRKCQTYKYKLKAEKSDPEYSIYTTGYFESKCRTSSNGRKKNPIYINKNLKWIK